MQYEQGMQDVRVKLDMLNAKHGESPSIIFYLHELLASVSDMSDQLNRYLQALLLYYSASDSTMQEAEQVRPSCGSLTSYLLLYAGLPAQCKLIWRAFVCAFALFGGE